METPVFRMIGSTTGGGAAVPSSGSVASSAATLSGAGSYPDPSGPDVQFPTTAAAQAIAGYPFLSWGTATGTGTDCVPQIR